METPEKIVISPIGRWGRFPTYDGKIGSGPSCRVLIRRTRTFCVGQAIDYCDEQELTGMAKGCTPMWQRGHIWRIDYGRLFIAKG